MDATEHLAGYATRCGLRSLEALRHREALLKRAYKPQVYLKRALCPMHRRGVHGAREPLSKAPQGGIVLERLPWFKMSPADYLLDTMHLTQGQHGAYLLLILHYFWNGSLPTDRNKLYQLACAVDLEQREDVDMVLARYFREENGIWRHNRIERELEGIKLLRRKQSEAGKASVIARQGSNPSGNGEDKPADLSPVVERLPLIGGKEYEVRQSLVDELVPIYPAVDVPATIREMRGWCLGNPGKLKTKAGIKRFITGWLAKEQAEYVERKSGDKPKICCTCKKVITGGWTRTSDGDKCDPCWNAA